MIDEIFEINGITWNLSLVEPYSDKLRRSDGSYTVGMTDLRTKEVSIANNLFPVFQRKVLCHELVHCAMFSYHVYLTIEQEELIADLIATYGEEIIDKTNVIFERLRRKSA